MRPNLIKDTDQSHYPKDWCIMTAFQAFDQRGCRPMTSLHLTVIIHKK